MNKEIIIPDGVNKIAFFADVHGKYECMLSMINENPDIEHWFCCGDLIDMKEALHNNQPAVRLARKYNVVSVIGNHEFNVRKNGLAQYDEDNQQYINDMTLGVTIKFSDIAISMFHASPTSVDEYIPANVDTGKLQEIFANVDSDIIVLGHLHESYQKKIGSVSVVNPGALGVPIDKPSYCIVNSDGTFEIKILAGED